ncbi:arrestin domain-containing protein 2-like [Phlebotomus argentipes]|uniref:arrestin domain-containing protein 2-like n=1 Tax=Phlebotomus argentipes TaxID=94469 RepID=UPI00289355A8|nr:arrestin domain-containing protein 2-like [Phlebotomus argentipes]
MSFSIKLIKDQFNPGELMQGELVVSLDKPRRFKIIYVEISGCAESNWKERGLTSNEYFRGRRDYFHQIICMAGDWHTRSPFELPFTAKHRFQFQLQLPHTLPPRISTEYGKVRFRVRAFMHVERSGQFVEDIEKKNIHIASHWRAIDPAFVRELPDASVINREMEENVKVYGEMPKRELALGEEAVIHVKIENKRLLPINKIKFQLRQIVTFYSMTPRRTAKTVINEVKESNCKTIKWEPGTAVLTATGTLKIPDYVLASYECCNDVISVSYDIKVRPKVKDDGEKLLPIFLPVILGHPPKQEISFMPVFSTQGYPHSSPSTSQTASAFASNPNTLPSYEDLMRSDAGAAKM